MPLVPDSAPFAPEQRVALEQLLSTLDEAQAQWLAGWLAGRGAHIHAHTVSTAPAPATATTIPLLIAYGSESGNAEELAARAGTAAKRLGFSVEVADLADLSPSDLGRRGGNLLLFISTWGEGDPPSRAASFHRALLADNAPRLGELRFAVLGLGDQSYSHFCEMGKVFDARLSDLGGTRLIERADCDVDYEAAAHIWTERALTALGGSTAITATAAVPIAGPPSDGPITAELSQRIVLNATGSEKEVHHLVFSAPGSALRYQPGDAVEVLPANCPADVAAVIGQIKADPQQQVQDSDGAAASLATVLERDCDTTGLNRTFMQRYAALCPDPRLHALLDDSHGEDLADYLWGRQIVDLLSDFPAPQLDAQSLVTLLRRLPPRLYSIASSPLAHPDEVHLTIAAVRYQTHGRARKGVCSTFLADRVAIGSHHPLRIHPNRQFRLPEDPATPIIMIGPGTGVAPFRAFLHHRAATGATGRSWLFFGGQRFHYDFLYQLEWQQLQRDGFLTRIDTAFSRDAPEKVYVQHRLLAHGREIHSWLEDGAVLYVCGEAKRMAHDVEAALLQILAREGALDDAGAQAKLDRLIRDRRYLRDVY